MENGKLNITPESIDKIFQAPEYRAEVDRGLGGCDNPTMAGEVYKSYESDYVSYLKENISSFAQPIEQLAPVIQSPLLQILKASKSHKDLDVRLSGFLESLDRGSKGKPGESTKPGQREE